MILTGAGKAFCAGYDLDDAEELASLGALGMLDRQERARPRGQRRARAPGSGHRRGQRPRRRRWLVASSDGRHPARIAERRSSTPRSSGSGCPPGDLGASWLLPRLIGPSAAAEIGFTGRMVEAEEAERLGLLNRVTGPDDLLDQTLAMANQICANSPAASGYPNGRCRPTWKSPPSRRRSSWRTAGRRF